MEYVELAQERLAHYKVERDQVVLEQELRRLGLTSPIFNPLARVDGLLIRMGKGAKARQARREYHTHNRELVS